MEFRESPLEDMVEMHKNYFGKKVFLTGHTGFKGSWFLILLKKIGAIVKGYSLEQENQLSLFHEIDGNSLCESFTVFFIFSQKLFKYVKYVYNKFLSVPVLILSNTFSGLFFNVNTLNTF